MRRVHTCMNATWSKVKIKVTELLKLWKLHSSKSVSSAIVAWSSKLMVDYDNTGPSLQLIRAHFLNFLLSNLSRLQTSRNIDTTGLSKGHISLLLEARVTWLGMLVVLYVLCMLIWPWLIQGQGHGGDDSLPLLQPLYDGSVTVRPLSHWKVIGKFLSQVAFENLLSKENFRVRTVHFRKFITFESDFHKIEYVLFWASEECVSTQQWAVTVSVGTFSLNSLGHSFCGMTVVIEVTR